MNYQNKKAFSLLEIILVIFLGSIIVVYSTIYSKELFESEMKNQELAISKIDLNSTRIIIEKNLPNSQNLLSYDGQKLYFDGSLLLDKVSFFSIRKVNKILYINIELDKKIKQEWQFKL